MRWSLSSGWSDLWTLRRWILSVRLMMAVVVLVGGVVTFAWSSLGGGSGPSQTVVPEAQVEVMCRQAALETERLAREFEEQTGQPAQAFSAERCADGGPATPAPVDP